MEPRSRSSLESIPTQSQHTSKVAVSPRVARTSAASTPIKLSIVMPAYNEAATIAMAVHEVLAVSYPCEIELIVVDDGSTDSTNLELGLIEDDRLVVHRHVANLGKGAAVLSGLGLATGTHFLPFDADREYVAEDIPRLLTPIIAGRAKVVYGTRIFGSNTVYQSFRYALGNRLTTFAANVLFDSYISDLHTCLKLLPVSLIRGFKLKEKGFGLDSEVTANVLKQGLRPFEVPVSYHSRSHMEGKKITWRDGVICLQVLGRVRFGQRPCNPPIVLPEPSSATKTEEQASLVPTSAATTQGEGAPEHLEKTG